MNNVRWKSYFRDGSVMEEFDADGNEVNFPRERIEELILVTLECKNGCAYGFNLLNGELILNGVTIGVAKNIDKRFYTISGRGLKYSEQLLLYKEACIEIGQTDYNPSFHYLGYEVDISSLGIYAGDELIKKCIVTLRVDESTFKPSLTVSFKTDTILV